VLLWHLLNDRSRAIVDYDSAIKLNANNLTAIKFRKAAIAENDSRSLSSADEPPEITAKPSEWYYVDNGVKKGPVSATTIADLLDKKQIETDTQVWRMFIQAWLMR
jgi:hypothetical protein